MERTFIVTATPGAVLDYLKDFAHTQEWDPVTQRASRHDAGPLAPGATWHSVCRIFGITAELTWTLVAAEPHRLVFSGRNEGATCTDTIMLRPIVGGTEVTYHVDLEMHGLAKLATPVIKIEFEKLGTAGAAGLTKVLNGLTAPIWHGGLLFPPPAPA
ncbi:SRPBCC family protein [Micromonosporaceae bacterium Da 78-11]